MPSPIELRPRAAFEGRDRFTLEHGRRRRLGQRAFTAPESAVIWTKRRQAEAIGRGFFLERSFVDEHAIVRPFGLAETRVLTVTDAMGRKRYAGFERTNTDLDIWRSLVLQSADGDEFSAIALRFIDQQDRFAYTGAWEYPCGHVSSKLLWLKQLHAADRVAQSATHARFSAMSAARWKRG